jgi:two-component system cell cycle response regulator
MTRMDLLVRTSLSARLALRRGTGLVVAASLAFALTQGAARAPVGAEVVLATVAWLVVLTRAVRTRFGRAVSLPALTELELGLLLAVGLDALLLRFDGSLSGPFSPAAYVLVAVIAAFAHPIATVGVTASVIALDAAVRVSLFGDASLPSLARHAGFMVAFAALNLTFLRAEVARTRMTARARVEEELARLKEDARRYRLLGAGEAEQQDGKSQDRLARSSVEEIHQSVHYALELLRRTLHLHTAVLLWLNDAGTHLRISELSTVSDDVHDAPFAAGDGVLGAVVSQRARVSLDHLKPSFKVPYYDGPCPVRALAALPILEGETLRGILAIDRIEDTAFTPEEEELAMQAARYCLRAIHNERVFVQLERAKVEQGKLYRAAQALGAATSEKDVLEAGVRAAREIASFDLAAVTIYDEETKTHEVCAAKSAAGEIDDLVGVKFAHNGGLVSMVVKNRYALPYKGEFDATKQVVLSRRSPWPKVPSLLVLPLVLHDKVLGTLILGARRRHAFGDAVRPTLEVLASHLSVSLSNARMVQKLEQMATTDGMTGLLNKRAMLEAAGQKVAASARFGRKLSVLVADIDWFKKVNDTYGHDVGDLVIKGLGAILTRQKRGTDQVARFGGEEFVVLCEQTDEAGAMLLGERIREELEKTTFHAGKETFRVTCSVGVATFPEAGKDWDALFKAADEALYASKHGGRNRVTAWVEKKPEPQRPEPQRDGRLVTLTALPMKKIRVG